MLRIDNLTYRIGGRVLLDQASATINAGHRVGLIGRNGTGKTTLLRLLTGAIEADGGTIDVPARWQVGITSQEAPSGESSLIDTVMSADRELTHLNSQAMHATDPEQIADIHARLRDKDAHTATARAAKVLAGLGFDQEAQQQPCSSYSGGWRMRVALAGLLFTQPDLLLLDEPTNHLDLEATVWLEDYLRRYPGTILLVSHDRDLLNRAVDEILHLENGKLTLYQGGYDRFAETRRMRIMQTEKLRVKQEAKKKDIISFVERFRYKATKAKQAQSRLKMLERMQIIPELEEEGSYSFAFPEADELPPPLINLDDVTIGYDGKPVLKNISLRIDADDRIALLGANGNGKSTLIKLLANRLAPMSGDMSKSGKLRVGYFAQHQAEELDLAATPVIELGRRRPDDSDRALRTHLGRFGFSQQRADTQVAKLSGGEKARLLFALMTSAKPHLLLLDEPTNHLDMDARDALTHAINGFAGAVIIISHDPHIVELTADRFWLVENGRVENYDGDMEDYRGKLLKRRSFDSASSKNRNREADPRPREAKAARPSKKRIDQAEVLVNRLTDQCETLRRTLADPTLYQGPPAKVVDLQKQLQVVEQNLAAAESAWLELQDAWEQVAAG
ncbi:MAG: ABC transporter ATP-binding protein [Rhodospirillaceae bacterium]|nr:MAG: ABC transporter ATP-binding protein [Rhodospirillaceae bacterium]